MCLLPEGRSYENRFGRVEWLEKPASHLVGVEMPKTLNRMNGRTSAIGNSRITKARSPQRSVLIERRSKLSCQKGDPSNHYCVMQMKNNSADAFS
jgi:hypothetical protein